MKIKKPTMTAGAPASGGAVIADRFRLDTGAPAKKPSSEGSVATTVCLSFAVLALIGLALLIWKLSEHHQYLFPVQ